ncbi:MAG: hypothetical protein R2911_19690 [Caldilineaceae bacterium]
MLWTAALLTIEALCGGHARLLRLLYDAWLQEATRVMRPNGTMRITPICTKRCAHPARVAPA